MLQDPRPLPMGSPTLERTNAAVMDITQIHHTDDSCTQASSLSFHSGDMTISHSHNNFTMINTLHHAPIFICIVKCLQESSYCWKTHIVRRTYPQWEAAYSISSAASRRLLCWKPAQSGTLGYHQPGPMPPLWVTYKDHDSDMRFFPSLGLSILVIPLPSCR